MSWMRRSCLSSTSYSPRNPAARFFLHYFLHEQVIQNVNRCETSDVVFYPWVSNKIHFHFLSIYYEILQTPHEKRSLSCGSFKLPKYISSCFFPYQLSSLSCLLSFHTTFSACFLVSAHNMCPSIFFRYSVFNFINVFPCPNPFSSNLPSPACWGTGGQCDRVITLLVLAMVLFA